MFGIHHELRPSEIRPSGTILLVTGKTEDPKISNKMFTSEAIENAIDNLKRLMRNPQKIDFEKDVLVKVPPIGNAVHNAERIIEQNKADYTKFWD
jgi:hypothetical protein